MAFTLSSLQEDKSKGSRRNIIVSVIMVSVIIHVLGGVGAAIYIVAKYLQPPEATFVTKKMVTIPPKIIDPKLAAAEFEAAAPKPQLDQKIASLRATDFALPDIPMMPVDDLVEFTPSTQITSSVTGLTGGLGAGGGGGGSGGGGEGDGMSFFGLQTKGRSVLIIFDISQSVLNKAEKAGVSIDRIREETLQLIDQLSINTTFTLYQFSRIYQPFSKTLVAPTDQNKESAKAWLNNEFRTDGSLPRSVRGSVTPKGGEDNGVIFVLKAAFELQPEIIFFISDGSFQSENHSSQVPWEDIEDMMEEFEETQGKLAQLNFIGFEMKDNDRKEMKKLVRDTDGKLKEMK
ncbi:MAG: hypothetical protein AAF571_01495 [Verrucomicrobiota bacterium]